VNFGMEEERRARALRRRDVVASPVECEEIVGRIFATVKRPTHSASHWEANAGQVTPFSVSFLLRAIGPISTSDVFLDVGSGFGNVVCQIVLQTDVSKAIGMELQKPLMEMGMATISKWHQKHKRLEKLEFRCDDVCSFADELPEYALDATIIFSNNVRFLPNAVYSLFRLASALPKARILVTAVPICARHRPQCQGEFCALWKTVYIVQTEVSWTCTPVWFYVYRKDDLMDAVFDM
jgi:hypothetical protein